MAFGDDDLDALFADMGVTVVAGSQTAKAILDTPEQIELLGQISGLSKTDLALSYKTTALTLAARDAITVDGDSYTVREVTKIDDGKLSKAILKTV